MTFVKNTFIFSSQMNIILPFKLECVNKAEKLCLMLTSCSVFCSAFLFFFLSTGQNIIMAERNPRVMVQ